MNQARRKAIAAKVKEVQALTERVDALAGDIHLLEGEEQEAFDAMSEELLLSEKGEISEAAIDHLADAADRLEEAAQTLRDALNAIIAAADLS